MREYMSSNYFQFERISKNSRANLFCFHCAGGSAFSYIPWRAEIDKEINIYPYQIAVRGSRACEKFPDSLESAAIEAAAAISALNKGNILFTGHSMGGMLAYYTAYLLKHDYGIKVNKMFITSSLPSLKEVLRTEFGYSEKMSEQEFFSMIIRFGAVDERMLKTPEFKKYFLPSAISDMRLINRAQTNFAGIINSDISVYYGDKDTVADETNVRNWKSVTTGSVIVTKCNGGHFFINEYYKEICRDINNYFSNHYKIVKQKIF